MKKSRKSRITLYSEYCGFLGLPEKNKFSFALAPLEHALDRQLGLLDHIIIQDDFGFLGFQTGKKLRQGVHLHETAIITCAMVSRADDE